MIDRTPRSLQIRTMSWGSGLLCLALAINVGRFLPRAGGVEWYPGYLFASVGLLCMVVLVVALVHIRRLHNAIRRDSVNLADQQFYTRSLVESNVDAIMVIDMQGVITDVNRQSENLTGFERFQLIGTALHRYCRDQYHTTANLHRIISARSITNADVIITSQAGTETEVSCSSAVLMDRQLNVVGVIISMRDMTRQKKFELMLEEQKLELLKARDVAEQASLAKTNFLSNMSHELRTPLNAILGFAQLMDVEGPVSDDTRKTSVEHILQGGWYLLELINEILDLASIESGKINFSNEKISLVQVLSECHDLVAQQALNKQIRLVFPEAAHQVMVVSADPTRLKQVLINLLSNAIKYNRTGGEVRVQCEVKGHDVVRVNVHDTGKGLNAEQLSHLFEPFNRLGSESGSEDGTGIGLVVTRQLVQLMGGRIGVESRPGAGSTFWFELPRYSHSTIGPGLASGQVVLGNDLLESSAATINVLYIEDNPINLLRIEQAVQVRGDITLVVATNGAMGIQMARTSLPALILLDMDLPDAHGSELVKTLKQGVLTCQIPLIAISALPARPETENGQLTGCRHYLTSPIQVSELTEKLNETLNFVTSRLVNHDHPDAMHWVGAQRIDGNDDD